jgi:Domain of unknown function (DUF4296)
MKGLTVMSFFILLFFAGCKKKSSIPSDILPTAKMESLLWDIMRADQFVTIYALAKDTSLKKEIELKKWYTKVFAFHKITEADFQKNFKYYKSHPALLQQVMDSIGYKKQYEVQSATPAPPILPPVNDSTAKSTQQKMEKERKKYIKPVSGN